MIKRYGKILVGFHHDGTATVQRRSILTGELQQLEMRATQDQFETWFNGELVQNAFPNLNADEREFIISGILNWDEVMKPI